MRALLVLTAATALQNAKDWHGASYDAALVEPRPSKACGGDEEQCARRLAWCRARHLHACVLRESRVDGVCWMQ